MHKRQREDKRTLRWSILKTKMQQPKKLEVQMAAASFEEQACTRGDAPRKCADRSYKHARIESLQLEHPEAFRTEKQQGALAAWKSKHSEGRWASE